MKCEIRKDFLLLYTSITIPITGTFVRNYHISHPNYHHNLYNCSLLQVFLRRVPVRAGLRYIQGWH